MTIIPRLLLVVAVMTTCWILVGLEHHVYGGQPPQDSTAASLIRVFRATPPLTELQKSALYRGDNTPLIDELLLNSTEIFKLVDEIDTASYSGPTEWDPVRHELIGGKMGLWSNANDLSVLLAGRVRATGTSSGSDIVRSFKVFDILAECGAGAYIAISQSNQRQLLEYLENYGNDYSNPDIDDIVATLAATPAIREFATESRYRAAELRSLVWLTENRWSSGGSERDVQVELFNGLEMPTPKESLSQSEIRVGLHDAIQYCAREHEIGMISSEAEAIEAIAAYRLDVVSHGNRVVRLGMRLYPGLLERYVITRVRRLLVAAALSRIKGDQKRMEELISRVGAEKVELSASSDDVFTLQFAYKVDNDNDDDGDGSVIIEMRSARPDVKADGK